MDSLVEQLLDMPQVRLYLAQVQAVLQDEERQRQHFYATLCEDQKAEFINGAIIVHSPVKFRHNEASLNLATLLHAHVSTHQLGVVTHEKVLVTLTRNDYEPDIAFFGAATAASFTPDQLHFPAPDLVVEVLSPSTETTDRTTKMVDYAAHGVSEYWLIDPDSETVEQYTRQDAVFHLAIKAHSGDLVSQVVAGFAIPMRAIFDRHAHTATLRRILQADR